MSEPEVYLEDLDIHRMPGFPPTRAFSIEDLAPGINVLHGPNASGKTTVAKAISLALHGAAADGGQASLHGRLRTREGPYEVRIDAGQRTFLKDGQPDPGPHLPSGAGADRYKLWLHELLGAEDPNTAFAEQVLQESAGGYDLRQAREDLALRPSPSNRSLGEHKTYRAKSKALQTVKKEVVDPGETERRLRELKQERERIQHAQATAAALQAAIRYREHQDALDTAERKLEALPEVLSEVTGREHETLVGLRDELQEAEGQLAQAEREIQVAEEAIEEADLPEGHEPPAGLVPELRKRIQRLQGLEEDVAAAKRTLARARGELEEARDALGGVIDPDALEDVDTERIQRAEQVAQQAEAHRQKQRTLDAVDTWLSGEEPSVDPEEINAGLRALRRWLQEPDRLPSETSERGPLAMIASLLVALAGLGGMVLSLAGQASLIVAIAGGGLLLVGLVLLYLSRSSTEGGGPTVVESDPRATYQKEFQRTPFEPPARWEPETVEQHLDALHAELVQVKLAGERELQRAKLAPDKEALEEEARELEEAARRLSKEVGIELDLGERSFLWVVRNLADWQQARKDLTGAQQELEQAEAQRDALLEQIADDLAPYQDEAQDEAATDAEAALTRVEDLADRFQTLRNATKDLQQARAKKQAAQEEVEATQRAIEALFTDLEFEPGDDAGLQRLLNRQGDHEAAVAEQTRAQPLRDQALADLRDEPGYEQRMEALGETELQAELDELGGRLDRFEELREEIPRLEEQIRHAKQEHEVEAAIAERDRALAALRDKMEEETAQVVGWAIAEHVHEQTRDQDRPPVFHRARELLATITRGRYQLRFSDGDPPTFSALDTWHKETKQLDELSSGTRVQLLLAVRLAFVERQEQGAKLPLLLDETLANTDDIRAKAIIEAVVRIAREGRQVFYLTAQDDEVAKWRQALENGAGEGQQEGAKVEGQREEGQQAAALPHRIIDLAEARALTQELDAPRVQLASPSRKEVPAPDGRDHQAYGQLLSVPPFNPREDVGAVHLWYLVEDPHLLHTLLQLDIERWGQLKTLHEGTGELDTVLSQDAWRALHARAKALSAYQEACSVGLGKPVDRAVLEEAPGVTENKIDEVAELNERVGGDASKLLEALGEGAVPYFRENQWEKLDGFLRREGYLDDRARLSAQEVQQRALTAVAGELQEGVLGREDVVGLLVRVGAQRGAGS